MDYKRKSFNLRFFQIYNSISRLAHSIFGCMGHKEVRELLLFIYQAIFIMRVLLASHRNLISLGENQLFVKKFCMVTCSVIFYKQIICCMQLKLI